MPTILVPRRPWRMGWCMSARNLIALNARTGEKLWGRTGDQTLDSSPTVVNGMIYAGSQDGKVYAFGLK